VAFIVGTLASGNTGSSMAMGAKKVEDKTIGRCMKAGSITARERGKES